MHDLVHGVWHFERGMFYTIKEALLRPGQAALDYIKGKRIRHYNVFYLTLLTIGLALLVSHLYHTLLPDGPPSTDRFDQFFSGNLKVILLSLIPVMAINGFLLFEKLRLNPTEHFILGGICLLGIMVLSVCVQVLDLVSDYFDLMFLSLFKLPLLLWILLFPAWTYFTASRGMHNLWGFLWRIIVFYIFLFIEFGLFITTVAFVLGTENTGINVHI